MVNDIVYKSDSGIAVTDSLKVSEIFGKEHNKVCRDIENLCCSNKFKAANFGDTLYTHPQNGQNYKKYIITKNGFVFLVMGYTGAKAAQFKESYIAAFDRMEEELHSRASFHKFPDSSLEDRIERMERILMLLTEPISQLKPKPAKEKSQKEVVYSNQKAVACADPIGVPISKMRRKLESDFGIRLKVNDIFHWFRSEGWLQANDDQYNCPSREMVENGFLTYARNGGTRNGLQYHTPYVTNKGFAHFHELIIQKGGKL